MTDNEIIKALECSVKNKCPECPYFQSYPCDKCRNMRRDALDLINRLQATIDDLNTRLHQERKRIDYIDKSYNEIKAEAYKECVEDIKTYYKENRFAYDAECLCEELNNFLKETVGEYK